MLNTYHIEITINSTVGTVNYLVAVPLVLGNAATEALTAHSGKTTPAKCPQYYCREGKAVTCATTSGKELLRLKQALDRKRPLYLVTEHAVCRSVSVRNMARSWHNAVSFYTCRVNKQ